MATPRFKVSTTIKNFVLSKEPWATRAREYGFDRWTDPEIIAEGLMAICEDEFPKLLDEALKYKQDQRQIAKEVFGR